MRHLLHPKHWLTITIVFSFIILQALGQPAFLKEGLVAYYPFNGNANDESGNSNNGQVQSAVVTRDRFDRLESAYAFDGLKSQITIPNLDVKGSGITLSLWFNLSEFEANDRFLSHNWDLTKPWGSFGVDCGYGGIFRGSGDNDLTGVYLKKPIQINRWEHWVVTFDGVNAVLYTNGVLALNNNQPMPLRQSKTTLYIGGQNIGNLIKGSIDDVRIYNRALSGEEVQKMYFFESLPPVQNSFSNGSFESPSKTSGTINYYYPNGVNSIPAWRIIGPNNGAVGLVSGIGSTVSLGAADGDQYLLFNGGPNPVGCGIRQIFQSAVGVTYLVEYQVGVMGQSAKMGFTSTVSDEVGNILGANTGDRLYNGWSDKFKYTFTAVSESSVVTFIDSSSTTTNVDVYLDNVRVVAVSPVISSQPIPATVVLGDGAKFCVTTENDGINNYQWQRNEQNITGAKMSCYTIDSVASLMNGDRYRVIISNSAGSVISESAKLIVLTPPPSIDVQPVSKIAAEGTQVSLTVNASGLGPLTYQWQLNQQNIPGATSNTIVLAAVRPSANGKYRVLVSNPYGTTISVEVPVIVNVTDADSDGLSDYEELLSGTDPKKGDTDGDGLSDFAEIKIHGSNPLNTDSDSDGYSDGVEVAGEGNPNNRSVIPNGALAVFPAVDVEFLTVNGVRYQLEMSIDMIQWTSQGGVVIGNGTKQNHLVRANKATSFWRLKVAQ